MSDLLRFERTIRAPSRVAFDAFTTRGGQEAFYEQDDPRWIVETVCDLRVGGEWAVSFGPDATHLFRHRHIFREIDVPRRLLMSTTEFRLDGSTLEFTTEFTFEEHQGRTVMTMTQAGLPAGLRDEHAHGLPNAFDRFGEYVSRRMVGRRR